MMSKEGFTEIVKFMGQNLISLPLVINAGLYG